MEDSKSNFDWLNASDYAIKEFRNGYRATEKKIATAYDVLKDKAKAYNLAQQYARKGYVVFDIQPLKEDKKTFQQDGDYYLKKVMYATKHPTEKWF